MRTKVYLVFFYLLIALNSSGQTIDQYVRTLSVDSLFQIVEKEQSVGNQYFDQGMFPSYRQHTLSNKFWKDENLFFSEIVLFTLTNIQDELSINQMHRFENLRKGVWSNFHKYRNKDGDYTYNFWKTNPSRHFPNSSFFSKHKKFQLPDDMDDTSIAYLTMDTVSSSVLDSVKRKMIQHSNQYKLQIRNIFKRYRNYQAYSTWFGKNMPIEFDICVLANTLYFVYEFDFELNHYDLQSLQMLAEMIESGDHLKYSEYLAPNYKTNTLVLYHLGRLIASHQPEILKPYRNQIVNELKVELKKTKSFMEQVLLSSTLMKLNEKPPSIKIHRRLKFDQKTFPFYVANMASMFSDPFKRWFAKTGLFSINYVCPAYNEVLIIENILLRNKQGY